MARRAVLGALWTMAVVGLVAGQAVQAIRARLFDPDFYLNLFARHHVYAAAPAMLARAVAESPQVPPALAGMVGELVRQAVTPDWVEQEAPGIVRGLIAFLTGQAADLRLEVSTRVVKARVEEGARDTLPPALAGDLEDGLASIPDRYDVASLLDTEARDRLRAARGVVRALMLLPVASLALAGTAGILAWLAGCRGAKWLWQWPGGLALASGGLLWALSLLPLTAIVPGEAGAFAPLSPWSGMARDVLGQLTGAAGATGRAVFLAGAGISAVSAALSLVRARGTRRTS